MLNPDYEMAMRYYEIGVENVFYSYLKGHLQSTVRMGTLLLTSPNQSHTLALEYLLKAAEAKSPDAMNLIGQMKELGLGKEEISLEYSNN